MRMISGAILILASEQAFAHAHSTPFPNQVLVSEVLVPSSLVLAVLGVVCFIWGAVADRKMCNCNAHGTGKSA